MTTKDIYQRLDGEPGCGVWKDIGLEEYELVGTPWRRVVRVVDVSMDRVIGVIKLDAKGHPFARLLTAYDHKGDGWKEGDPFFAATAATAATASAPATQANLPASEAEKADAWLYTRASGFRYATTDRLTAEATEVLRADGMTIDPLYTRAQPQALPLAPIEAASAIVFATTTDDPKGFLNAWLHGDWDVLRKEWPEAPKEVYPASERAAK